jgi:hypothetical protein
MIYQESLQTHADRLAVVASARIQQRQQDADFPSPDPVDTRGGKGNLLVWRRQLEHDISADKGWKTTCKRQDLSRLHPRYPEDEYEYDYAAARVFLRVRLEGTKLVPMTEAEANATWAPVQVERHNRRAADVVKAYETLLQKADLPFAVLVRVSSGERKDLRFWSSADLLTGLSLTAKQITPGRPEVRVTLAADGVPECRTFTTINEPTAHRDVLYLHTEGDALCLKGADPKTLAERWPDIPRRPITGIVGDPTTIHPDVFRRATSLQPEAGSTPHPTIRITTRGEVIACTPHEVIVVYQGWSGFEADIPLLVAQSLARFQDPINLQLARYPDGAGGLLVNSSLRAPAIRDHNFPNVWGVIPRPADVPYACIVGPALKWFTKQAARMDHLRIRVEEGGFTLTATPNNFQDEGYRLRVTPAPPENRFSGELNVSLHYLANALRDISDWAYPVIQCSDDWKRPMIVRYATHYGSVQHVLCGRLPHEPRSSIQWVDLTEKAHSAGVLSRA